MDIIKAGVYTSSSWEGEGDRSDSVYLFTRGSREVEPWPGAREDSEESTAGGLKILVLVVRKKIYTVLPSIGTRSSVFFALR